MNVLLVANSFRIFIFELPKLKFISNIRVFFVVSNYLKSISFIII